MTASATDRYLLRAAPAGLALVQEFLNTRDIAGYGPDLLSDPDLAGPWLTHALTGWSTERGAGAPELDLTDADLRALRTVRESFLRFVDGHGPAPTGSVPATLVPGGDGVMRLVPAGSGWRWLTSALWTETLLAQQAGTWPRLKLCRNDACRSAFYDGSRNNSGVWHDVRTCGNVANLRASRARRRPAVPPEE